MFVWKAGMWALCALALAPLYADDAFVGTWRYDREKSDVMARSMSLSPVGENKWRIGFGAMSFDITADGTDQASLAGATWAITALGSREWRVVIKNHAGAVETEHWTLSPDSMSFLAQRGGGRAGEAIPVRHWLRSAGAEGFAGTWLLEESVQSEPGPLLIETSPEGGLHVSYPEDNLEIELTLDGRECRIQGPAVPQGLTVTAKRAGSRTIRLTDWQHDQVLDTTEMKLSADGRVLTVTEHDSGSKKPVVWVYERDMSAASPVRPKKPANPI